ncbi:MAG: HAMP domain-containing sensor histidine kinase [Candidatus Latescibacterota bacterium]
MNNSFRKGSIKGFIALWIGTVVTACVALSAAVLLMTEHLDVLVRKAARDAKAIETAYRLQTAVLSASRQDLQWRRTREDSLRVDMFNTLQRAKIILSGLEATANTSEEKKITGSISERFNRFSYAALSLSGDYNRKTDSVADDLFGVLEKYRQVKVVEMEHALQENFTLRNDIQHWLILLAAGVIGIVTIGSVTLFRRTIRPVIALSEAAARFGHGDLSARVRVERDDELGNLAHTFNNMAEDIDHREKNRLDFSASIFHDIKNPLVIIGAAVRMLRRKTLPPDQVNLWLDRVIREIDRIEDLSQDLMDSVQIESGRFTLQASEVDFGRLVADLYAEQNGLITSHTLVFEGYQECPIIGDRRRLERAIINLLSNAVKYSPAGATITLKLERRNDTVAFSITDQGIGISPKDRKALFQPFGRLSRTCDMARGAGLGLYIVKRIIDAHRGTIRVDSRLGAGTMVEISLPTT